jgi:hypothetical protein
MLPHRSGPTRRPRRSALGALLVALGAAACGGPVTFENAPATLAGTGLFADAATGALAAGILPFEPQYPLWTDGARKRRWIALPPGAAIDASDVDHWRFPIGTRLWKEFTFPGGETETRFLHRRADGSWLYATYVQRPGDGAAILAPDCGVRAFAATAPGRHHDVPSQTDCRLCHEGTRTPVLGFAALQLSPDRDPLAPNAVEPPPGALDLAGLAARGLIHDLPADLLATPPRIAARSAVERAALGYLHGNCSSCHNGDGPLQRLGVRFDYPVAADPGIAPGIATTLGVPSQFRRRGLELRIAPGAPGSSVLVHRLAADDALAQMPPFGRHLVDRTAVALLTDWIAALPTGPAAPPVAAPSRSR